MLTEMRGRAWQLARAGLSKDSVALTATAVEKAFKAAWAEQPSGRTRGLTPDQAAAQVRQNLYIYLQPEVSQRSVLLLRQVLPLGVHAMRIAFQHHACA